MKMMDCPNKLESVKLLKSIVSQKLATHPEKVNQPLALYGAGDLGKMAKSYFDRIGIQVDCVIDRNADLMKNDPFWKGLNVVLPSDVSNEQKNQYMLAVCIVTMPYMPLATSLKEQGWKTIVPFYDIAEGYRDQHPLSNGWFANKLKADEINNIVTILNDGWSDDISRAHHLQFITWRLIRQEWSFEKAPVNTENRFFIPEILDCLHDNESFVDVGAHHGRVSEKFINITKGQFDQIWMFEPDSNNLKQLQSYIEQQDEIIQSKMLSFSSAIGKQSDVISFYEGLGYASQISTLGRTHVEVMTLDQMGLHPSFIKLHIEGGELDALKGCKKTLLKYRPIIVLTSYHNDDGIWKLPLWLINNLSDYHYYMRLHSWSGTGAVIYCVPYERNAENQAASR